MNWVKHALAAAYALCRLLRSPPKGTRRRVTFIDINEETSDVVRETPTGAATPAGEGAR